MGCSSCGYTIRAARTSDVAEVVDVHLASFQDFSLTFLGGFFLECLDQGIFEEPGSVFLVAFSLDGALVGFVAGVPLLLRFYRRLLQTKWVRFMWASAGAVFRRPSILPRLWRARGASRDADKASCPATLMSIAVAPAVKGMGIGTSLVKRFLEDMANQGVQRVCLATDRDNNTPTISFYEGLHFKKVREYETPERRWMSEYMIETPHRQERQPEASSMVLAADEWSVPCSVGQP
jgi:ribosomal protein S18 acetylase RimI-like enzyme